MPKSEGPIRGPDRQARGHCPNPRGHFGRNGPRPLVCVRRCNDRTQEMVRQKWPAYLPRPRSVGLKGERLLRVLDRVCLAASLELRSSRQQQTLEGLPVLVLRAPDVPTSEILAQWSRRSTTAETLQNVGERVSWRSARARVCVHFVCLLSEECGGSGAELEMAGIVLATVDEVVLCHAVHVHRPPTRPHVYPPLSAFDRGATLMVKIP